MIYYIYIYVFGMKYFFWIIYISYILHIIYIYIYTSYIHIHACVFSLGFIRIAVFLHIWGFIKDMGYLRRTNLNRWEVMINWGWTF